MKKLVCLLLALLCFLTMTGCATVVLVTKKAISKNIEETVSAPEISVPQDSSDESLPETEDFLKENFGSAVGGAIENYIEENAGENLEEDLRSKLEEKYGENYQEEARKELEKHLGENYSPELEAELKEYLKNHSAKDTPDAKSSSKPTAEASTSAETAASATESAFPTVEELVITDFETRLVGEDSVGNTYDCTYRIPSITLQSEDAQEINRELNEWLTPYIEEQQKYHEEGISMVVPSIDYEAWIYNEVLTLVVTMQTDWSQTFYRVYNLDIYSGEDLDNEDLLRRTNLTESAFFDALYAALNAKFDPAYAEMAGEEFFTAQRERTLSEENLEEAELFFDAKGNAFVHVLVYSLAGADSYEHLLELPML